MNNSEFPLFVVVVFCATIFVSMFLPNTVAGQMPDMPTVQIPDMVAGRVFDAASGNPIDGVNVSVSGNASGILWEGKTGFNSISNQHGEYNTGHTLSWVDGEELTVSVSNGGEVGYRGSTAVVAPADADLLFVDVYVQHTQIPEQGNAGFRQDNASGDVVVQYSQKTISIGVAGFLAFTLSVILVALFIRARMSR